MKKHSIKSIITISTAATLLLTFSPAFGVQSVLNRSSINSKYKWKTEDLYPSAKSWKQDFSTIEQYIPKFLSYTYDSKNPNALADIVLLKSKADVMMDRVLTYSTAKSYEDKSSSTYADMYSDSMSLWLKLSNAESDFALKLIALPASTLNSLLKSQTLSGIKSYIQSILTQKKNNFTKAEQEAINNLSYASQLPEQIYNSLTYSDMKVASDNGGYTAENLKDHENTFASILNAKITLDILNAKQQGFKSPLDMDTYYDYLSESVYNNQITVVGKNAKYLNEYVKLKAKYYKTDELSPYQLYSPFSKDSQKEIKFDTGVATVEKALSPLGKEYVNAFSKAIDSRWVDVYPTTGKYTGGVTLSTYGVHPFVLINYANDFDSMLTMSHEMGHAMNGYYISKTDKGGSPNAPSIIGEIPSTLNELLTLRSLIAGATNDDQKIFYLDQLAIFYVNTVYDTCMESEFEDLMLSTVENGGTLTASFLNKSWTSLMKKYYGSSYEVSEIQTMSWATIPHFFMNHYNYKYALCASLSNRIAKEIISSPEKYSSAYIDLISSSNMEKCSDALVKLKADYTSTSSLRDTLSDFDSTINELDTLLKKRGILKED